MTMNIGTVSIQRTVIKKGIVDLTVTFKLVEGDKGHEWVLSAAIDEDGHPTSLTKSERELAYCLIHAGVDETGR